MDHVPVVIGGLCSSETLSAAPIAERGKTVLFSPCSSAPAVTNAGDFVFRNYPSDAFQGKVAAEYAFNKLGKRKVAVLYCLSDWCTGLRDVFSKRFTELGGQIIASEGYEQSTKDLRAQLTKIKDAAPDLLYFVAYTEASIVGLKQAKELGLNTQIMGGDAWEDPKIWSEVGEAGENALYFAPSSPANEEFKNKMLAKDANEITVCTPNAYDAVKIVAQVMRQVGTDPEKIKEALYKVQGYNGVSGEISFDENGDLKAAAYNVKQITNGTPVVIDTA